MRLDRGFPFASFLSVGVGGRELPFIVFRAEIGFPGFLFHSGFGLLFPLASILKGPIFTSSGSEVAVTIHDLFRRLLRRPSAISLFRSVVHLCWYATGDL